MPSCLPTSRPTPPSPTAPTRFAEASASATRAPSYPTTSKKNLPPTRPNAIPSPWPATPPKPTSSSAIKTTPPAKFTPPISSGACASATKQPAPTPPAAAGHRSRSADTTDSIGHNQSTQRLKLNTGSDRVPKNQELGIVDVCQNSDLREKSACPRRAPQLRNEEPIRFWCSSRPFA